MTASPDTNAELEEGEYFHYQLIGMSVRTEEGEDLGEIQEILETGSNDVYIVRGSGGELLIPAVSHVVLEVERGCQLYAGASPRRTALTVLL